MKLLKHPIRSIREPFGTAGLIVACVALVAALGGTALAAAKLNSTQKKEVEKIAKKYAGKPGAPGAAGTNGTNGTNGKDGAEGKQGSEGKEGKAGEDGQTGFTKTLPAGQTETGSWTLTQPASGGDGPLGAIPFSIPLAAPLGESQVHLIGKSGEELIWEFPLTVEEVPPTKCGKALTPAGTVEKPAAAPGNLCVYLSNTRSTDDLEGERMGSTLIFDPGQTTECVGISCSNTGPFEGPGAGASPAGAYLTAATQANVMAWGSWAVTAP